MTPYLVFTAIAALLLLASEVSEAEKGRRLADLAERLTNVWRLAGLVALAGVIALGGLALAGDFGDRERTVVGSVQLVAFVLAIPLVFVPRTREFLREFREGWRADRRISP